MSIRREVRATRSRIVIAVLAVTATFLGPAASQSSIIRLPRYFEPLLSLDTPAPLHIGSRNISRCCLQAIQDWIDGDPHVVIQSSRNTSHYFSTPQELADSNEQFGCGASYQGDTAGATRVWTSHGWCNANCRGWQISKNQILTQWIQPFVGFILPATVFCLNVPRKAVFNIADALFPNILHELNGHWRAFVTNFRSSSFYRKTCLLVRLLIVGLWIMCKPFLQLIYASFLGVLNVMFWISVVFSMATPMILSGLYEASIDRQLLRSLEEEVNQNKPGRVRYQVHMLFATLVGNLELENVSETEGVDVERSEETEPHLGTSKEGEARNDRHTPTWEAVNTLVKVIPEYPEEIMEHQTRDTKERLITLLAGQANFGLTVGSPMAFFLGSFLFNIFGNLAALGDNDNSHALAFGEWWMVIPHVAIISSCLLAGNDPNTLKALCISFQEVQTGASNSETKSRSLWQSIKSKYSPFYKFDYQPVWMWERGRNKYIWIKKIQQLYNQSRARSIAGRRPSLRPVLIKDVPQMGILSWFVMIFVAVALVAVPSILALITSYYTPTVGLSCRSLTFLLYFAFQPGLVVLWFVDFMSSSTSPSEKWRAKNVIILGLASLFFAGSAFSVIAGTAMQLIGVYRNCTCAVPASMWNNNDFMDVISTNSGDAIYFAQFYWLKTGLASMILLIVFCYLGWWYQRHWRARFRKVTEAVLRLNPTGTTGESYEPQASRTASLATPVLVSETTPMPDETPREIPLPVADLQCPGPTRLLNEEGTMTRHPVSHQA